MVAGEVGGHIYVKYQAISDIEEAVIEALDKQYADVLAPLKENMTPKKFGLKYVQKLTKRTSNPYVVPPKVCQVSIFFL
ncbi:hypothetical protein L2E82_50487 [Cichorium intybus]|nr:hypothetical protein L2E82_50487 [Cichorium intybus]